MNMFYKIIIAALLVSMASTKSFASSTHNAQYDEVWAAITKRLRTNNMKLDFASSQDTFSFRLAIAHYHDKKAVWMDFMASSSVSENQLMVLDGNGLLYALADDHLLLSAYGKNDGQLTTIRNAAPLVALHPTASGAIGVTVACKPNSTSGDISLLLGTSIHRFMPHSSRVKYDKANSQLVCVGDTGSVIVDFNWKSSGRCPINRLTLKRHGHPVVVVSDIHTGSHTDQLLDARAFAAIWQAMKYPTIKFSGGHITSAAIVPPLDWSPTTQARKRLKTTRQMMKRWPKHSDWLGGNWLEEHLPPEVLHDRKQALKFAKDHMLYDHLKQTKALMSQSDVITRVLIVGGAGVTPIKGHKEQAIDLLSHALKDQSAHVRIIALSAIAAQIRSGGLSANDALPLIRIGLNHTSTPMATRSIADALEQISHGKFNAGPYPRKENGVPTQNDQGTAWWVVHSKQVREKANAWLNTHGEAGPGN